MNCLNCNKVTPIWGKNHKKFCDLLCSNYYFNKFKKKLFNEKPCYICQKPFLPISIRSKYCSYNCSRVSASLVPKKRIYIKKVFKEKNCVVCNAVFLQKNVNHKNCSLNCKRKHEGDKSKKNLPLKKCSICEKDFKPYTSLDKFCSYQCRIKNVKSKRKYNHTEKTCINRSGKNNPSYVHGMSVRGVKLDSTGIRLFHKNRDSYKKDITDKHGFLFCEVCNKSNVKFETHHIVYRSEKPKHEFLHNKINLILVCVPCHNWFHNKKGNRNEIVQIRQLQNYFGNDVLDK